MYKKILYTIIVVALLGLASCDNPTTPSNDYSAKEDILKSETADYGNASKGKSEKIKGQYIVVFNNDVQGVGNSAAQLAKNAGGEVKFIYETALKGFALTLPEQASERALQAIQNNPNVNYIEKDIKVFAFGSQSNATWGLDRSDQRSLPIDGIYNYSSTGENITVYVADTGINYSHVDFGGRATFGFDAFGGDGTDCDGHGTHVSGTVGGSEWGIAKNVDLVAVRVLDCQGSGTLSGVVAGIDWITANASGPSVVNMSLGGGGSSTLDSAVQNSIAAGITYVVAAGNSSADACNYSPARVPEAITVGSSTSSDSRSSFSNYGSCVDLFAPGSGITSAYIGSTTATATLSGTSMASPHVAGAAALYLFSNSSATPAEVETSLISYATQNIISNSNTENNHLLYTIFDGSGDDGGSGNSVPNADFTYSTEYLAVQFTDASTDSDGSISSWLWDFGDGNSSTSQNPAYTYNQAGTYTVTLTVTDDAGDSDSVSKSVTVNEQTAEEVPVIDTFTINAYTTGPWQRADVSWTVTDANSNLSSIKTELLNGSTIVDTQSSTISGGSASGLHEHRTRGNADAVRLTVTDDKGNSTTSTKNLDGSDGGNTAPTADFTYSTDFLNVQFNDGSSDSDGSIVTWSWNFGDGTTSSTQNPSHSYGQAGTYTVSLTVTDDAGATDTIAKDVSVDEESANTPPVADFTYNTDFLSVQFTDQSTDSDGTIVSWSWNFGDGGSSSLQNPSYSYSQAGTYTVSLTVTDDAGDTDTISTNITVEEDSDPGTGDINLTANGYKNKGRWTTDLSWSGTSASNIDIYRDGTIVNTVSNSGSYTDRTNLRGGGSLTYKVCEAGTITCSNQVTVNF